MNKTLIFVIIILLLCSSCMPYPHYEVQVPILFGTITKEGMPLRGAEVKATGDIQGLLCSDSEAVMSETDSDGRFMLTGKKEFFFSQPLFGHSYYFFQLCIITDEEIFLGYSDGGSHYGPDLLNLNCMIKSDSRPISKSTPKSDFHRYAVCTKHITNQ